MSNSKKFKALSKVVLTSIVCANILGFTGSVYAADLKVAGPSEQLLKASDTFNTVTLDAGGNPSVAGKVIVGGTNPVYLVAGNINGTKGEITLTANDTLKVMNNISNSDLNVAGGTLDGSFAHTAGSLALDGMDIKAGITSSAIVTIKGVTTLDGKLRDSGTYSNDGTLTVKNAANLAMSKGITNSGTINLGDVSKSTLGAKISGGTLNVNGDVSADASYIAAATNTVAKDKKLTLTHNSGNFAVLGGAVTGEGKITVDGNVKTAAGNLGVDVTINKDKSLNLTGGDLGKKVDGAGEMEISGNVTALDASYISVRTNVDGDGKLTLKDGTLGGKVSGTGAVTIDGAVTADAANIAADTATSINSGKTLTLKAGTLGGKVTGVGTLAISEDVSARADYIAATTNTVAKDKKLTLTDNSGTAVTLAGAVTGEGTIVVDGNVKTTVDNLGVKTDVKQDKELTLTGGTLKKGNDITGTGKIVIDGDVTNKGQEVSITQKDLTINEGKSLYVNDALELTIKNAINNSGTLSIHGGTIGGDHIKNVTNTDTGTVKVTGNGKVAEGKVTGGTLEFGNNVSDATCKYLASFTNTKIEVSSGATVTLNSGADNTLTKQVSGDGTLVFNCDVTAQADYIATKKNTVAVGKTLTLTGANATLAAKITDEGTDKKANVAIGDGKTEATVTATLGKFAVNGDLTVNTKANLKLTGNNTLDRNIKGNGTVTLAADKTLIVASDILDGTTNIEGTLTSAPGKAAIVQLLDSDYKTFVVGNLAADANIGVTLDVDLEKYNANKLKFTTITSGSKLSVAGINIVKDFVNDAVSTDLAFVISDEKGNATYSQATENKVLTGKGVYTFTASNEAASKGIVHIALDKKDSVFKDYATNNTTLATYSKLKLASDYVNTDGGTIQVNRGEAIVNLDGYDFTSNSATTVAVNAGKSLVLTGGADKDSVSIIDKNTNFEIAAATTEPNVEAAQMFIQGYTKIDGTIENKGKLTVGRLINGATTFGGKITNTGTFTVNNDVVLNGGLDNSATGATATFSKKTEVNSKITLGGTTTNKGTMTVKDASNLSGDYEKCITNEGTINLGGDTESTLGARISGGGLEIKGAVRSVANYIDALKNTIAEGATLTLTDGTLLKTIANAGTLKIDATGATPVVTFDSGVTIAGAGDLVVEKGLLDVENKDVGIIKNDVEIKAGASLDPLARVFAAGTTVNNYGGLAISRSAAEESADYLQATVNLIGGDAYMKLEPGSIVLAADGKLTQTGGARLIPIGVDAKKGIVTGVNDAAQLNVAGGVLDMRGESEAKVGDQFVLVEGDAAASFVTVPGIKSTNLWNNVLVNYNVDNTDHSCLLTEYFVKDGAVIAEVRNVKTLAEANTSGLAGVQQGAFTMVNQMNDKVAEQMSLVTRPVAEQGQKYEKKIWASYNNNKEDLTDRELWNLKTDNTAKYSGAIVGVDFFSSEKAVAGVALSYGKGDITANTIDSTHVQNDSKYYGISVYDRVVNDGVAFTYDIGYQYGKNDIAMSARERVTANTRTQSYTAGVRVEKAYNVSAKSTFAPFASLRFLRLHTGDYTNSNGARFEAGNQNFLMPKLGVAWKGNYGDANNGWAFNPVVEVGYNFNCGGRNVDGRYISATGHAFNTDYDIADSGTYYGKLGLNFNKKNFSVGVDYRYLKGSTTKNNRWNVNLGWSF